MISTVNQPVIFITLYVGYKLVKQTKFQQFRDFRNAYFMPEFNNENDCEGGDNDQGMIRFVLGEVWSYIK
jgi:hypothetical protein